VTHQTTGRYEVTFPGVDASQVGVAHVTSDVPTVECQLQGSYAFGETVTIGVGCRGLGTGAAADARFGIAFSVSTAPPQGGSGGYAALIADEPEHSDYTPFVRFSSSGVDPRIEKPAVTGLWYVHLTGTEFAADAGQVQVGAFQTAAHCGVAGRSAEAGGVRVAVQCWTPHPTIVPTDDAMFEFSYVQQRNVLGRTNGMSAYLRSDAPNPGNEWWSSTGAVPVVTGDRGNYRVTIADVPDAPFNVMVTANNPTMNVCTTFAWYRDTTTNPPSAQGQVYCRNSSGSAATAFSLILTTP
jgi:hypothetical protein